MGYKYIIEVEKSYAPVQRRGVEPELPRLYLAKGFNSLVFDEEGLNKLEKYDPDKEYDRGFEQGCAYAEKENKLPTDAEAYGYEKGYEKGLADSWEAAKIIVNSPVTDHLEEIFGTTYAADVIPTIPVNEAIHKLGIYEEKQKDEAKIRVGDEVQLFTSGNTCRGVVLRVADKRDTKLVSVIQNDGFGIFNMRDNKIEKTGRHFPEVAELLQKMQEVEE